MPRFRDDAFDDDQSDRLPRRKRPDRRGTAVLEPTSPLGAEVAPGDPAAPSRRRERDVGRRRHAGSAGAAVDDRLDWEDDEPSSAEHRRRGHKPRLADGSESFKCGHCKAFIGPTVAGGRHRNHCPLCLYSRHVDDRRMGDRASPCRALMAPIGVFYRPKGEQVVVHRCLGCGFERHNRVAADDNVLLLAELPELAPRVGRGGYQEGDEEP